MKHKLTLVVDGKTIGSQMFATKDYRRDAIAKLLVTYQAFQTNQDGFNVMRGCESVSSELTVYAATQLINGE